MAITKATLHKVIEAIEDIVGDDYCEDLEYRAVLHPENLSERESVAAEKLSKIYRLSHAFNLRHSCHNVHANWRKELDAEATTIKCAASTTRVDGKSAERTEDSTSKAP